MGSAGHADNSQTGKWKRDDVQVADRAAMRRSVEGMAVGNFMEWYDFGLYGFVATSIAEQFYPGHGGAGSLIATFGTQAAAFAVRPFGGSVFGPLGDRIGRKRVLMITILLLTTRVLQAFSTGGEYAGAMTYVDEHAPDNKRGTFAGFLPMGSTTGYVAAAALVTGLQAWLPSGSMTSWGWRLPFLLGAPLGLVMVFMRRRVGESPAFENTKDQKPSGAKEQFRQTIVRQWKPMLICLGFVMMSVITKYMLTGYLPTYLKKTGNMSHTVALAMILAVMVIIASSVVFAAKLSDRIGVKPIMWTGCGLLVAGSIPAFLLIRSGSDYPLMFIGVLVVGLALLCFHATEPETLPALFPTGVRYGSLAIAFNISVAVCGGSTPLITQSLKSATGSAMVPAYVLTAAGLIGAVALIFMPEVAGKRMPGSGPTVENEDQAREISEDRRAS